MPNSTTTKPSTHKWNIVRRLYDWMLALAQHPHALPALFLLSFAEATFFPIPPDALLLAMAVAAPQHALRFALVCTLGSISGAIVGYLLGWGFWSQIDHLFYQFIPGFSEQAFTEMAARFSENTFVTIFTAGFTPIPFKIFTIAAGAAVVPFISFVIGAAISRALRFYILAGLIHWCGPGIKDWIERYFNILTVVATVLLIAAIYLLQQH